MPQSYRPDPAISAERREQINRIFDTCRAEWHRQKASSNERADTKKIPAYAAEIENAAPDFRVDVLVMAVEKIRGADNPEWLADETDNYPKIYSSVQAAVAAALARKNLPMTEAQAVRILDAMFADNGLLTEAAFLFYPVAAVLRQIQKQHGNAVSAALSGSLKTAAERYRAFAEATRYSLNSADKKTLTDVVRLCGEMTQSPAHKEIPMTPNQSIQPTAAQRTEFKQLLSALSREWRAQPNNHYIHENMSFKGCPSYAAVETASPEYRLALLAYLLERVRGGAENVAVALARAVARKALPMSGAQAAALFDIMFAGSGRTDRFYYYPIKPLLKQIQTQYGENIPAELSGSLKNACARLQEWQVKLGFGLEKKDLVQVVLAFDKLTGKAAAAEARFPAPNDAFARYANPQLAALPPEQQDVWSKILTLALSANAGKPSEKYLKEAKTLIDGLGADRFKKMLHGWIEFVCNSEVCIETVTQEYSGGSYNSYDTYVLPVGSLNQTALKGLVWMCSHFHDSATLSALTQFALHSYEKIPNLGARYAAVGNACFYALFRSKGLDGIACLSRLRLRIKFSNVQSAIAKYLDEAAAQRGVSRNEIEDMAVDSFGLQEGCRDYDFGGYTCRLAVMGVGKSELRWFKPDGSPQKTVPAFVKTDHADKLKKLKAAQKNLNTTLTAQRDRLDQMMRSEHRVPLEHAEQYYWQHGLMSCLTRPLIWQFFRDENDTQGRAALWLDGTWVDETGEQTDFSDCLQVSLWHPALATQQSIARWRKLLLDKEIRQPLKQAYREIYLLTEAEINTKTYSNRFAAHILKQHQYMTLAKGRGWKGSLAGAWDGGDDATVSLDLPEYNLRAEFWTNAVDSEEAWTESGIWQYVSTDQVRFHRLDDGYHAAALDLIDIPPRVFSEVLRDVDLFVGVASVGNDPTWEDNGGQARFYSYWQSYSFGDLGEVAKTRKAVLETLLPRLKIAKVARIDGNFLVVQGKLRTYKIHIGSSNILMLPDDQYLCIVPDSRKKDASDKLFIPFEGDNTLSVVLSKAMLLAEDDKITDSTITSQIKRGMGAA